MSILMTLLVGLIVGVIAKFMMPGRDPGGFIVTALLGIVGAFLASYLGQAMNFYVAGEPAGFIASVIGAMLVLFIYRLAVGRRTVV
ncbi:MAG: GlsB/YeaQ/YmgE family stress response membrane protein [Oligoflexia bacterium]|nr:GlsB/YeaQ/YmgE family stress response membrane protein [Oligoflexia bacterium]